MSARKSDSLSGNSQIIVAIFQPGITEGRMLATRTAAKRGPRLSYPSATTSKEPMVHHKRTMVLKNSRCLLLRV